MILYNVFIPSSNLYNLIEMELSLIEENKVLFEHSSKLLQILVVPIATVQRGPTKKNLKGIVHYPKFKLCKI